MEVTNQVDISRSQPEVFAARSRLERIPEWFADSLERRKLTDGPTGVGSRFLAVDRLPPNRRIEGTLEVTEYQPHHRMRATLSDPYNAWWEATFEPVDGGTRMTMHTVANLGGFQGLIAPILRGWAARVQQKGLDNFATAVQAGITQT